jgi:formiminotetrahydrofolate cyclodeaminase
VRAEGEAGIGVRSAGWLTRLSGKTVNPAAGSAAALTGAMGVALLIKLARRTQPERVPKYDQLLDRLLNAMQRLAVIAESDASAVTAWLSARQLQEGDPTRRTALQRLVSVPLEAAELLHSARLEAEPLLAGGHPPTVPDGQAGIRLIMASQEILCALVEADLSIVSDPALVRATEEQLERLRSRPPETAIR